MLKKVVPIGARLSKIINLLCNRQSNQKLKKSGSGGKQKMQTRNYFSFDNVLIHIQLNQFESQHTGWI
jgi:hypothetical protein